MTSYAQCLNTVPLKQFRVARPPEKTPMGKGVVSDDRPLCITAARPRFVLSIWSCAFMRNKYNVLKQPRVARPPEKKDLEFHSFCCVQSIVPSRCDFPVWRSTQLDSSLWQTSEIQR